MQRAAHWKPPTKSGQNSETWRRSHAMQDTNMMSKTRNRRWPPSRQVTMTRRNRQDRGTRGCEPPSRGTRAPTGEPTILKQQSSDVGGGKNHGIVNYHKAILMKTEMKGTARVRRQREDIDNMEKSEKSKANSRRRKHVCSETVDTTSRSSSRIRSLRIRSRKRS